MQSCRNSVCVIHSVTRLNGITWYLNTKYLMSCLKRNIPAARSSTSSLKNAQIKVFCACATLPLSKTFMHTFFGIFCLLLFQIYAHSMRSYLIYFINIMVWFNTVFTLLGLPWRQNTNLQDLDYSTVINLFT